MNTPYTSIFDLFMMQITDYHLIDLFNVSETDFNNYLQGFLVLSIPDFDTYCNQDLSNRNDTTATFNYEMNLKNQQILSKLMVKQWLGKEVKNILQMRTKVQDKDFKTYSEAQNLTAKQNTLVSLMEECSTMLTEYSYQNNDWGKWISGNFLS